MIQLLMKLLKIIGICIFIPIVLIVSLLFLLSFVPSAPNNYTKEVNTGGKVEEKYLKMGNYKVQKTIIQGSELTKNYTIYYPKELNDSNKKYPVVIVLNGTGVLPKKYKALFKHLASWGFVVIGNDDGSTGFGTSADETMNLVISENKKKESVFYRKLDLDNIGITGHSQGGAGVFTAISIMENKDKYKTAVSLSPTHEETAHQLGWNYDLTNINIPTFMLAGTEGEFETQSVIPIEKMIQMYNKITSPKVMLRRIGAEHGQMLYSADGYVTAWFMWQLQNDSFASEAFIGKKPEIKNNHLYQDVQVDIQLK